MNGTHSHAVDRLLQHYQDPYVCEVYDDGGALAATASMHLVGERKLLSLANIGTVESDDFVYIYSLPVLDEASFERLYSEALEHGVARVDPNPNHNFSLISILFLCDSIDAAAAAKLKKTKYSKKFSRPQRGTIDLRLAAVEVDGRGKAANPLGKSLLNIYKDALR